MLTRVEELEAALTRVETRIGEEVAAYADPFVPEAVELLESMPGVGKRTAQTMVAAIGVEMSRLPSAKHLARGAGVRRLGLTHFSQRYEDITPLLNEARAIHADTVACDDLTVVDVPKRKRS